VFLNVLFSFKSWKYNNFVEGHHTTMEAITTHTQKLERAVTESVAA
jgi:hypothetical protein